MKVGARSQDVKVEVSLSPAQIVRAFMYLNPTMMFIDGDVSIPFGRCGHFRMARISPEDELHAAAFSRWEVLSEAHISTFGDQFETLQCVDEGCRKDPDVGYGLATAVKGSVIESSLH